MEDLDTWQTDGSDAAIPGQPPESLGLNEVIIGEFRKAQAPAVERGIHEQHGAADTIQWHAVTMAQVA